MERAAELHLAPRQVSVGVSGGISILYHGLRLLLEVHPDFLVVRIDLRNAYNESRRAQVLQRMAAVPGVASLVPLMHAMYGPAGIIVLPDGSRLFAGSDHTDDPRQFDLPRMAPNHPSQRASSHPLPSSSA